MLTRDQLLDNQEKHREHIRKSFPDDMSFFKTDIEKGKALPVGTIREWGGVKHVKHADGWVVLPKTKKPFLVDKDGKKSEKHSYEHENFGERHKKQQEKIERDWFNPSKEDYKNKNYIGALQKLDVVLHSFPNSREALHNKAFIQRKIYNYKSALENYDKILELYPKDELAIKGRKDTEQELEDYKTDQAIKKQAWLEKKKEDFERFYNKELTFLKLKPRVPAERLIKAVDSLNTLKNTVYKIFESDLAQPPNKFQEEALEKYQQAYKKANAFQMSNIKKRAYYGEGNAPFDLAYNFAFPEGKDGWIVSDCDIYINSDFVRDTEVFQQEFEKAPKLLKELEYQTAAITAKAANRLLKPIIGYPLCYEIQPGDSPLMASLMLKTKSGTDYVGGKIKI